MLDNLAPGRHYCGHEGGYDLEHHLGAELGHVVVGAHDEESERWAWGGWHNRKHMTPKAPICIAALSDIVVDLCCGLLYNCVKRKALVCISGHRFEHYGG